jgi:hypothetical protein
VGSGHDPVSGNDGATAHVESRASLDGHLPGDLTGSGRRASDDPATDGGQVLGGAMLPEGGGCNQLDFVRKL